MLIGEDKLIEMYRKMLLIRCFEERVNEIYLEGRLPGFVHLYSGEEAVAVGCCSCLRVDDFVTSTHRGHGHCIAKGGDVKRMMAELLGREAGYCRGKGGSMHIADKNIGFFGGNGIVGAGLPLAVGLGLSIKLKQSNQVVVCFFGDGASNQGTFHESINLASTWRLPVIFVCENNLYAVSMPASNASVIKDIAERAHAYGVPGKIVDGMDVIDVYKAANEAVRKAREGLGPTLIECKTYRYHGHYIGEQTEIYRTKDEEEAWKKKDPIKKLELRLLDEKFVTESISRDIRNKVAEKVEEAIRFGESSPPPRPEEALEDLFTSHL